MGLTAFFTSSTTRPSASLITDGSAQRTLAAVANHKKIIPASSTCEKNSFLSGINEIFKALFNVDFYKSKAQLQANAAIPTMIGLKNVDEHSTQSDPIITINRQGYEEIHVARLMNDPEGGPNQGVGYVNCTDPNNEVVIAFQPGIDLMQFKDALSKEMKGPVKEVIKSVLRDFSNDHAVYSNKIIHYALKHTEKQLSVHNKQNSDSYKEISACKDILDKHPNLTFEEFKVEVAHHRVENATTNSPVTKSASLYLLNNTILRNDKTYAKLAAHHILRYLPEYHISVGLEAIGVILKAALGCSNLSPGDAADKIIRHPEKYSPEENRCAVLYFTHHPERYSPSVFAKAVIENGNRFTNEEFAPVAQAYIHKADGCRKMSLADAARRIMTNSPTFAPEFVRSAAHYIVSNRNLFDSSTINIAGKYIAAHPTDYPKEVIDSLAVMAKKVVEENIDFFLTPIIDHETGNDLFVSAFKTEEQRNALVEYSKGFGEVLTSNSYFTDLYKLPAKLSPTGDEQGLSFLNVWTLQRKQNDPYFEMVLKNSPSVVNYILSNLDHPAMKIWNEVQMQRRNSNDGAESTTTTTAPTTSTTSTTLQGKPLVLARHVKAPSLGLA